MRRVTVLLILLLVLTACTTTDDDADTDIDEPLPTPTEVIDEPLPEPTPTPTIEPTPEPEPTATPEPEDDDAFDLDAFVDQVVANVVELRGLEMLEELQFSTMSREELAELLEEEIVFEQQEIDYYWILRLLDDRDIDLERVMIDVQAADIYGFYDLETQETYVIADGSELSALEEVILAHEITHALQDQHFDLSILLDEDADYDASMAFLAMVEGDAVLTQEFYAQRYLGPDRLLEYQREALSALGDADAMAAVEALPPALLEILSFPYYAGPQFMLQAYEGDLASLDEHLMNPPVSTQQVLNPNAYLGGEIEPPVEVMIEDMHDRLGDGWELWDEGAFGVFDLILVLEENGIANADEPLEGWRGSRFALYDDGDDVAIIVATQWESADAAATFETALLETLADADEDDGIWVENGRYHAVIIDGDMVTLKSASDEAALRNLAQLN
jgi:hypothetical protein